jgi:3'-5' exoribonuclease
VSGAGLPDARAWLGAAPFPWPAAGQLGAGDAIAACYAVVSVQRLRTRQDKPYLRIQLTDCHGPIEARVWDGAERVAATVAAGGYVGVRGRIEVFNNERQLKVEIIEPVRVELEELRLFLPHSARPVETMEAELRALLDSVQDPALRTLLDRLLGETTETGRAYRIAPAAKFNHHACIGGLLEHSLSVATVCSILATHYGAARLDRDLLVTAALIHDIGKIREIGAEPGFPYTDEGKLLGHILIGLRLLADAARDVPALEPRRLLLLEHLVASHQGRYEWQSPREPRTLEAILLHYADDLDAKMTQVGNLLAGVSDGWSAYDRSLQREFHRHATGDRAAGDADGGIGGSAANRGAEAAGADAAARDEDPPAGPSRTSGMAPEPAASATGTGPDPAPESAPSPAEGDLGKREPRPADDSLDLFGD